MPNNRAAGDSRNGVWSFLSSVRLTVGILLTLAATSIIGTLIPQNADPEAYRRAFGETLFHLFAVLRLYDMYHSWWFQLLVLLLAANIIVCSFNRLSSIWKFVFTKNSSFRLERFRSSKQPEHFTDSRPAEVLRSRYAAVISKSFGRVKTDTTDEGFAVYGEKWRWSRLGVYIVHLSVVILLAGALVGSFFGFEGFVNIPEGESVGAIRSRSEGQMIPLDFEIRCNDFSVTFYPSGEPREFRSSLTLLEDGKDILTRDIIVNDPLEYRGIRIFQSSYGRLSPKKSAPSAISETPPEEIQIHFTSVESGMIYHQTAKIGQPMDLPEGLGKLVLTQFDPSAKFGGQDIGAAYVGILTPTAKEPEEILLPLRFPNFDKMRRGRIIISAEPQSKQQPETASDEPERYYTGLQITRDPGVWLVYAGFVLMIAGCIVTFFTSHQQVCVDVVKKGAHHHVRVAGIADKNRIGMRQKVKKLARQLMAAAD